MDPVVLPKLKDGAAFGIENGKGDACVLEKSKVPPNLKVVCDVEAPNDSPLVVVVCKFEIPVVSEK